jgi:glycopeptide antibiotics resistance protein
LDAVLKDPIGNVVLFVPLGLLLPIGWAKTRELKKVVLAGAGASTIIELSQFLFGLGSLGTIDDVIFNTLGAVMGFALWLFADRIFRTASKALG